MSQEITFDFQEENSAFDPRFKRNFARENLFAMLKSEANYF